MALVVDAGDPDPGQLLTVPLALLVAGLVLELLDDDLRSTKILQLLSRNLHISQVLRGGGDFSPSTSSKAGSSSVLPTPPGTRFMVT